MNQKRCGVEALLEAIASVNVIVDFVAFFRIDTDVLYLSSSADRTKLLSIPGRRLQSFTHSERDIRAIRFLSRIKEESTVIDYKTKRKSSFVAEKSRDSPHYVYMCHA